LSEAITCKKIEAMILEVNKLYHIYNQGNNRQKIFFSNENYLFFLKKIKLHILPHADIIAWCLMPNHFHLMIYVHALEIQVDGDSTPNSNSEKIRNVNDSIGLILRTYTRAINKQENRSGSLFKPHTKAECIADIKGITPLFLITFFEGEIDQSITEEDYPQLCFKYIHANPVKAKLVERPEDWEFSSYRDYCGLRNGKLINKERAAEFGLS
jgi:putative transposase